jgi:hypothetical protein
MLIKGCSPRQGGLICEHSIHATRGATASLVSLVTPRRAGSSGPQEGFGGWPSLESLLLRISSWHVRWLRAFRPLHDTRPGSSASIESEADSARIKRKLGLHPTHPAPTTPTNLHRSPHVANPATHRSQMSQAARLPRLIPLLVA